MELKPYQACRSTEGWQIIEIPSTSNPYTTYAVHICPWKSPRENICQCPSYSYRGHCKHQDMAMEQLCGWTEIEPTFKDKIVQTDEQRIAKLCPRCGGTTKWEVEVIDD